MNDVNKKEKPAIAGILLSKIASNYGIKHVFGIPDGHTLAFYDGMCQIGEIQHTLVNDERTAGFAADAYARVTGTLGVCDAGPAGALNFPIALAEANGAASPVLAIVGTVKTHDILRNIPHDINIADTLAPVTKWTGRVTTPDHLPRFFKYAIRQALFGRPGSVALVVSEDIFTSNQLEIGDFGPKPNISTKINQSRVVPAPEEVECAVHLIQTAQQPVIFAGGEAVLSQAFEEIDQLSRLLKAPVFTTITGKGIMLQDNEMHFGTVGLFGEKPNHAFLRNKTDLVIVIGNRLTEDDTANFKFPSPELPMIQIDIDPAIIGLTYHPVAIIGDPKTTLLQLIQKLKFLGISKSENTGATISQREVNLIELRVAHEKYRKKESGLWMASDPIKPQRILKAISDAFSPEDFLVTDASSSSRWIGAYFPVKSLGRKIITPRGVGPTGFGLGALLGTCVGAESVNIGEKTSKKVLFTGDGGLMNGGLADLETLKQLGIACTIVVLNNQSLGYIKYGQAFLFERRFYQTKRQSTDFARIAESFGGRGYLVEKLSQLDTTIKEAFSGDGIQLVDVIVDQNALLPPNFY